jgi:predicted amidohydrolase YtcJ
MARTLIGEAAIRTLNPAHPNATAVLIEDSRFLAYDDEIGPGAADTFVNLEGATVLPGFVDAHQHLEMTAIAQHLGVDCRPPGCGSVREIKARLRAAAARTPEGEWILGQGTLFQDVQMEEKRYPSRDDMDEVSRTHPIAFRASLHVTILNSKALETVGINRNTPAPPGGVIERDEHGEPTGFTRDVHSLLGIPYPTPARRRSALAQCIKQEFLANGVTSIGEISYTKDGLLALAEMQPSLRIGVYLHVPETATFHEALGAAPELFPASNPRYRGIKLFLDGGTNALAAAYRAPYKIEPSTRGQLSYDVDELKKILEIATDRGVQVIMHATGDRAEDTVIAAARALPSEKIRALRHRIEHAGNIECTPERRAEFRDAGFIPVPNPGFIHLFGDAYEPYLGDERTHHLYTLRSLVDEGFNPPAGGDCTGTDLRLCNPFFGVWNAVVRRTRAGMILDAKECLGVEDALRMYTTWAAFALRVEREVGSIEPGKLADFIVVAEDPFRAPADRLDKITVLETWIGGTRVFERSHETASVVT